KEQEPVEDSLEQTDQKQQRLSSTALLYFYHPDHLGTSTFLTDYNGNAYQFFLNLPFGETMAEQKSITEDYETPYKFNGKELDEETGLYYYGARYYDPKISIWLSVDPLAEKGPEYSPYCFAMNSPINMIDPDGRWPFPSWAAIKSSYKEAKRSVIHQTAKATSWVSRHVVIQVEAKATVGAQIGVKTPFGSLGGGLVTTDIGKVGLSNSKGAYAKGGERT
ncbi:MAG: hypothetical protein DI548_05230, partial [Flavobacterium johnsoniae]